MENIIDKIVNWLKEKPIKVSFDFDYTLSQQFIQSYAYDLVQKGYDVHVVTARREEPTDPQYNNDDLYRITDSLNIPRKNIHFTNHESKQIFFDNNPGFLWHLDDDPYEILAISYTKTIPVFSVKDCIKECNKIIKKHNAFFA